MGNKDYIYSNSGNYRILYSYRKAETFYDVTRFFCQKHLKRRERSVGAFTLIALRATLLQYDVLSSPHVATDVVPRRDVACRVSTNINMNMNTNTDTAAQNCTNVASRMDVTCRVSLFFEK